MRFARPTLLALLVLVIPADAHAQPARQAMEDYFSGERIGGGVLIGMGATGLTVGALLYADGGDHARGASYPLLGFGLLHTAAGTYIAIASTRRRNRFRVQLVNDERAFLAAEQPRMEGVRRQLRMLKYTEMALVVGGLAFAAIGNATDRDQLEGAGWTFAAEAGGTLFFDVFASKRARRYSERLAVSAGTEPASGKRIGWLVYSAAF